MIMFEDKIVRYMGQFWYATVQDGMYVCDLLAGPWDTVEEAKNNVYYVFFYESWDVFVNYNEPDGPIVDVVFTKEEADLVTRMHNVAYHVYG